MRSAVATPVQQDLFETLSPPPREKTSRQSRKGAFVDNMQLPVHRWFRYSAGFSAEWVAEIIETKRPRPLKVLDPFAGSGTTLIAAQAMGVSATGIEAHPFVARVAAAKLQHNVDVRRLRQAADDVLTIAKGFAAKRFDVAPDLLLKCYSPEALEQLYRLRSAYEDILVSDPIGELVWLAITAILRQCSGVGTAQWQYVLPNRSKSKVAAPYDAFERKINEMIADIRAAKPRADVSAEIIQHDIRTFHEPSHARAFDLIITSPPYPNNYDYADATRLEMTFWGQVGSWGDLHEAVRRYLICSCSQHAAADRLTLEALLSRAEVLPIQDELDRVCTELGAIRETKGGKKTYHTMVAQYFVDLAVIWQRLRPLMKRGSQAHFMIGDSAPYGVHVPCERWLGELALGAGFKDYSFTKIRDRNLKWKNRKHRVPLHEGILTVRG